VIHIFANAATVSINLNGALLTINTHSLTAGIVVNDDGSSTGDGCAVKQIPDGLYASIIAPSLRARPDDLGSWR
jgi:hypothetical protein